MKKTDCHGCAFRIESQTVPQAHVSLGGVRAGESSFLKENKMMAVTTGVQHIGLAVSKLEESAAFFTKILGWEEVKRRADYPAIFVRDNALTITLWKTQTDDPVEFNRKTNVGLHHLALRVENKADLFQLLEVLKANQIEIEFEPTVIREGPSMHMMCYDPSGIRIEFYYPGQG